MLTFSEQGGKEGGGIEGDRGQRRLTDEYRDMLTFSEQESEKGGGIGGIGGRRN